MASRVFRGCRAMRAAAAKSGSASMKAVPSSASASTSTSTSTSVAKKPKAVVRSVAAGSGILNPYPVSPALGDFMGGVKTASRSDAVKKIWEHIKTHNLQDPANKKVIHCDAKLKTIFEGKDEVGFQEIAKLLSAHIVKIPSS